jgi:hypothetical protein
MTDRTIAARVATFAALPIAIIVGIATFWWLGGLGKAGTTPPRAQSTAPVAMPAVALGEPQATACRDLFGRLPATLRDRPRRPVTEGPQQNAAYGDPAITMTCGAPAVRIPATADVYLLSGVCWYSQTNGNGTVWTTVDRDTPVGVRVPDSYRAPGQWVIEFSAPVASALPRSADLPAGCSVQANPSALGSPNQPG